jgi:NhaA family Na+:H+ antiporter
MASGIHATIAGVILAFTIPCKSKYQSSSVAEKMNSLTEKFNLASKSDTLNNVDRRGFLQSMENLIHEVETPLQRLEHKLHIPVTYIIIPIFVLFNAGVTLSGTNLHEAIIHPLAMGIIFGLVLGKMIGIFFVIFALVKLKWASLPQGVELKHIIPLSLVSGIGFTMSIFIAELAFPSAPDAIVMAKVGILAASVIAAIMACISIFIVTNKKN